MEIVSAMKTVDGEVEGGHEFAVAAQQLTDAVFVVIVDVAVVHEVVQSLFQSVYDGGFDLCAVEREINEEREKRRLYSRNVKF